uniref:Uncharacterized protein n=1 Tax=Acrobeloides nanus TaxID=290746 RepID=A0A914D029_9BILA
MLIGVPVTVTGTFMGIVNKIYPTIFNLYSYLQMAYQQLFLAHVIVCLYLWVKGSRLYVRKIKTLLRKVKRQPIYAEKTLVRPVVLKNVEGKAINKVETIDEYFKQLDEMWK